MMAGLFLRWNTANRFGTLNPFVALFEMKNRFKHVEDGRPAMSDACFAQMTCEALAARLRSAEENSNERLESLYFVPHDFVSFNADTYIAW